MLASHGQALFSRGVLRCSVVLVIAGAFAATAAAEKKIHSAGPIPPDLKRRSASEGKIESALTDPRGVNVEFLDMPLDEALEYFGATFNVPVVIEEKALEAAGMSVDEPINRTIVGALALESGLAIVLSPLDLTYVIEDEVLKVTTRSAARTRVETRIYPIHQLLDADFPVAAIQEIVKNSAVGDDVKMVAFDCFLAITQSQPGHRRTAELSEQLRRAAAMKAEQ